MTAWHPQTQSAIAATCPPQPCMQGVCLQEGSWATAAASLVCLPGSTMPSGQTAEALKWLSPTSGLLFTHYMQHASHLHGWFSVATAPEGSGAASTKLHTRHLGALLCWTANATHLQARVQGEGVHGAAVRPGEGELAWMPLQELAWAWGLQQQQQTVSVLVPRLN